MEIRHGKSREGRANWHVLMIDNKRGGVSG